MKKCIICDLDGVYVDSSKWTPYIPQDRDDREGWDLFASHVSACTPNLALIRILKVLSLFFPIIFITSREGSVALKKGTEAQIDVFSNNWIHIGSKHKLFMRPYKDYRDAWQVKRDIMIRDVLPYYEPIIAIDDEIDNILMYKSLGLKTWHYTKFC